MTVPIPSSDDDAAVLNVPIAEAGVSAPALVTVKFLQQVEGYNGGEIAGFPAAAAAKLIADGIAVAYP